MKNIIFIYIIIISSISYSQDLKKKVGDIEVKLIEHYYKENSNSEVTKRKTNNWNRPSAKIFYDSTGKLLKQIKFGTNHNSSLKLIGEIEVYNYSSNLKTSSLKYISDCYCEKKIEPYFKTIYTYNEKEQLTRKSTYYHINDSLFDSTTYEYDRNSNKIRTIFDATYYYERDFDSLNRITSLKQVHDNKVRWEWNYTYLEKNRIGIFQTYYNDGKDYSKKEIQTFNKDGLLIELEEKNISKGGLDEKMKLFYSDDGMISKIEYYRSFSNEEEYKRFSYTDIKIKSKVKINSKVIEQINNDIFY